MSTQRALTKPYTWSFFKQHFSNTHTNTMHIYRSISNRARYQKHVANIKNRGQYALHTFKLSMARPLSIDPNLFPYHLEHGLKHWLLWVHPAYQKPDHFNPETIIRNYFNSIGAKPFEFVWFKNDINVQSFREVEHYHIILKCKPKLQPRKRKGRKQRFSSKKQF